MYDLYLEVLMVNGNLSKTEKMFRPLGFHYKQVLA